MFNKFLKATFVATLAFGMVESYGSNILLPSVTGVGGPGQTQANAHANNSTELKNIKASINAAVKVDFDGVSKEHKLIDNGELKNPEGTISITTNTGKVKVGVTGDLICKLTTDDAKQFAYKVGFYEGDTQLQEFTTAGEATVAVKNITTSIKYRLSADLNANDLVNLPAGDYEGDPIKITVEAAS